jgi:hypothetical protein
MTYTVNGYDKPEDVAKKEYEDQCESGRKRFLKKNKEYGALQKQRLRDCGKPKKTYFI